MFFFLALLLPTKILFFLIIKKKILPAKSAYKLYYKYETREINVCTES
jgi:hypothetical protein